MTAEDLWDSFNTYDQEVFPWHFVVSIAALVLIYFIIRKPGKKTDFFVNLFFMLCYLWIGGGFFLYYRNELSMRIQYFQPVLMLLISFFFFLNLIDNRNEYKIPESGIIRNLGIFLVIYSIAGYPLIGWLLNHPYAVKLPGGFCLWVPILGLYPCPTTVLGIALLSCSFPRVDMRVFVLLVLWALFSIIGKPIIEYRAYEDIILFLAGIYGTLILVLRRDCFMKGKEAGN